MTVTENLIVGELVAHDYRYASIFKRHGIDFCCSGNRSIKDACEKKKVDSGLVVNDLNSIPEKNGAKGEEDFNNWSLDRLADYIEGRHHQYVQMATAELKPYLDKVCRVHGGHHPELLEIKKCFDSTAGNLAVHMKKEELILFPFIKRMVKSKIQGSRPESAFGSVKNPIAMMMQDHDHEGESFRKIAELTSDYSSPDDACNTYRVTFALLREFEQDLHMHIHLENNILFPKAIELEKELLT